MKFDCVNVRLFVGRGLAPAVLQSNYEKISLFVCGGSKCTALQKQLSFCQQNSAASEDAAVLFI